jgi:hypothetical protein
MRAWYNVQGHFLGELQNDTGRTGPTWAKWIFRLQGVSGQAGAGNDEAYRKQEPDDYPILDSPS